MRKNMSQLLHKDPFNGLFHTKTIKISCRYSQKKFIHEKILRFACARRPQCAKMCLSYYIRTLLTPFYHTIYKNHKHLCPSQRRLDMRGHMRACGSLLEPSWQNKMAHEKNPTSRAPCARSSARKCVTLTT